MNRIIRTLSLLALVALVLGVLVVPASAQDATAPADSVDSAAIIDRTIEDVDIAQGELRLWNFTPWMRGTLRNANSVAGELSDLEDSVVALETQLTAHGHEHDHEDPPTLTLYERTNGTLTTDVDDAAVVDADGDGEADVVVEVYVSE